MSRKSKKLKGLDPNSAAYWNEILAQEGLTMWEGVSNKLTYVGDGAQVEKIKGLRDVQKIIGGKSVKPAGHGPNSDET